MHYFPIEWNPYSIRVQPKLREIKAINSYRAKIYASLEAVLFLHSYSEYHCSIKSKFRAIYDNQAYINKLNWLLEENFYHHCLHEETENEALQLILRLIPKQFSIQHAFVYQDSKISRSDLTAEAKLNIAANKISTTNAKLPINTHVISSHF